MFYRWLGIETLFVMDPEPIQTVLLDDAARFSKQPINDDVFGGAIGGGLLNAEGQEWRWQRRLAAPLFRAEDILAYVPAFAASCEAALKRWGDAGAGARQPIDRDMTRATLQVLQDTVLGANLSEEDQRLIETAAGEFLVHAVWKLALTSVGLPASTPHPGARSMARAGQTLRQVAERVLAETRATGAQGEDLLGRLVKARDPATGEAMPDNLIVDNVVTFLVAGHETTSQALTWSLYLLALFPEWQARVREEVLSVIGDGPIGREHIAMLPLLGRRLPGGDASLSAGPDIDAADIDAHEPWRRRACRRRHHCDPDLCGPPPPASVARPAPLRPLTLHPRQSRAPLHLYALLHRTALLHRRRLRHGRGQDDPRHAHRPRQLRAAAGEAPTPLPASRSAPKRD